MIIEGDFYRKTLVLAIIGLFLVTSMIPVSSLSIDKESCESTAQPIEDLSFNSTFPYLRDDIDISKGLSKIEDFEREVYEKYPWHYDQHLRNHSDYPFDEDMEKQGFWEPKLSLDIKVPDINTNHIPVIVTLKNHRFLPIPVGEMDLMQLCDYGRTLDFEIVTPDQHTIYFMGGHLRKDDYRVWLIPFGKKYYLCDLTKECFGEKEEECYSFLDNPGTYTIKAIYNSDGLAFAPNLILPHMANTWDGHLESETKTFELEKSFIPTFDGNTLYVGGTGPNNYTKIQDAINVASDGDTVFVYGGTYYEKVIVDKSITLHGEDRDTTVIDGSGSDNIVDVGVDWVTICGFTIQNSRGDCFEAEIDVHSNFNTITRNNMIGNYISGIRLDDSSGNTITGNTITDNHWNGIYLDGSSDNNMIIGNTIGSSEGGIWLRDSSGNTITGNTITDNADGIWLRDSSGNTITGNTITDNRNGICLVYFSSGNTIIGNTITDNGNGIRLFYNSSYNRIKKNNFIGDSLDPAFFEDSIFNIWVGNYWSNWQFLFPRPIHGIKTFNNFNIEVPWLNFDWHPAKEPYDILPGGA